MVTNECLALLDFLCTLFLKELTRKAVCDDREPNKNKSEVTSISITVTNTNMYIDVQLERLRTVVLQDPRCDFLVDLFAISRVCWDGADVRSGHCQAVDSI